MFRVAARIGLTVQELGERMTAAEFAEWRAFLLLENGQEFVKPGGAGPLG